VKKLLGLVPLAALVAAGCGLTVTSRPSSLSGTIPPTASATIATPSLASRVDRALLDYLPEEVDGVPIQPSQETEDALASDPLLATVSVAYAAGFGAEADDWVVALVVRLRPGVMGETWFRDWRDTFNTGVCEQAGGVMRTAETEIGGRTVYVATCAGGVRTYHVWLEDDSVVISAQAVGERRLGERLVGTLRP
jgi:hypothetical protein